jgi:hypothetical protein
VVLPSLFVLVCCAAATESCRIKPAAAALCGRLLTCLQELQARHSLPPGAVEVLAVEHRGDLDSLAASLEQQQQQQLPHAGLAYNQQQQQHYQQQQQQPASQQVRQPAAAHAELPGGGLFGGLALTAEQSFSVDSWGQSLGGTTSQDTASSSGNGGGGGGCFSAFAFSGFAEAALHAVHGGGSAAQGGLLGGGEGAGTPTSRGHPPLGSSIWGSSGGGGGLASPLGGGLSSEGPPGGYGSETHLLSLLGVSDAAAGASAGTATGSGFGLLGSFDALQPSSTQGIFDPRVPAAASAGGSAGGGAAFLPFGGSGGGGLQPQAQHQPFSGLPLWELHAGS